MFNTTNNYNFNYSAGQPDVPKVDVWTRVTTIAVVVTMLLTAVLVVAPQRPTPVMLHLTITAPVLLQQPSRRPTIMPVLKASQRRRLRCHNALMVHTSTVAVETCAVASVRRVADSASTTDYVSVVITPTDQARDWKRRWREIERRSTGLQKPRTGSIGGESVHVARDELHAFYIECYHLKDVLKVEAATLGITGQQVEDAITADPVLALLADLANLDKHAKLDAKKYPPRSGHVPTFGHASGASTGTGWLLELPIIHGATERDGLDVAHQAVEVWRRLLIGWKLL
jgi:hypothetical protein